ncbi:MAG TPA: hypothetical protein PL129_11325, partial [bacterium]|nr:hypothetical protein [bacterium]
IISGFGQKLMPLRIRMTRVMQHRTPARKGGAGRVKIQNGNIASMCNGFNQSIIALNICI